jgi:hypothetical protein
MIRFALVVSQEQRTVKRLVVDCSGVSFLRASRQTNEALNGFIKCWLCLSPRSGREHKAWGVAERNPRVQQCINSEPVKRATAGAQTDVSDTGHPLASTALRKAAAAHYRGLCFLSVIGLGFRCAPPQALCCHPLRGLGHSIL